MILWVKNLGEAQLDTSSAPYGINWNHSVEFGGRKGWSGGPDGFTPMSGAQGGWLEGWAQLAWRGITWPFHQDGLRVVRHFLWWLEVLRGFKEPGSISLWFLSNTISTLFYWSQSPLRGKRWRYKPHLLVGGLSKNSQAPLLYFF